MEAFLCCKMAWYPYFTLRQWVCLYIYTYIDTVIFFSFTGPLLYHACLFFADAFIKLAVKQFVERDIHGIEKKNPRCFGEAERLRLRKGSSV
jgi:hypothetical protein